MMADLSADLALEWSPCALCCDRVDLVAGPDCCAISLCQSCSQDYLKWFQSNQQCRNCGSSDMTLIPLPLQLEPVEAETAETLKAVRLLLAQAEASYQTELAFYQDLDNQITTGQVVNRLSQSVDFYRQSALKPYHQTITKLTTLITNLVQTGIALNLAVLAELRAEIIVKRAIGLVEWFRQGPGRGCDKQLYSNLVELHVIADRYRPKFTGVVIINQPESGREPRYKYHTAIVSQTTYLNGIKNGYCQVIEGRYLHVYTNYKGHHHGLSQTWQVLGSNGIFDVRASLAAEQAAGDQLGLTVAYQFYLLREINYQRGRRQGWLYTYRFIKDTQAVTLVSREHFHRDQRHGLCEFTYERYYVIREWYQYGRKQFLNDLLITPSGSLRRSYFLSPHSVTVRQDRYSYDHPTQTRLYLNLGSDGQPSQPYLDNHYDLIGQLISQTSQYLTTESEQTRIYHYAMLDKLESGYTTVTAAGEVTIEKRISCYLDYCIGPQPSFSNHVVMTKRCLENNQVKISTWQVSDNFSVAVLALWPADGLIRYVLAADRNNQVTTVLQLKSGQRVMDDGQKFWLVDDGEHTDKS